MQFFLEVDPERWWNRRKGIRGSIGFYLRIVTRNRWMLSNLDYAEDVPADTLQDIETHGNRLSVWDVEDNQSNLRHILIAVACMRQHFSKIDYVLIPVDLIRDLGIKTERTDGKTAYAHAIPMHRDLLDLSGMSLVRLAAALRKLPLEGERKCWHRTIESGARDLLVEAHRAGQLTVRDMDQDFVRKIQAVP